MGVPVRNLGTVSGDELIIKNVLSLSVSEMKKAHETWFPEYMS
jgi:phosphoribosylformylglycinamidine synthase